MHPSLFTVTAWLRPPADPGIVTTVVASFQSILLIAVRGIFLSVRIKLQSDKFPSVLKSLYVFLLVIMVPALLFNLNSRPHILCPPPA